MWSVEGDVDRVERFEAGVRHPGVAEAGVREPAVADATVVDEHAAVPGGFARLPGAGGRQRDHPDPGPPHGSVTGSMGPLVKLTQSNGTNGDAGW